MLVNRTQGLPRMGVIHSLGQLRDGQSELPLAQLLGDSDVQVARAAAWAAGELGTAACAEALLKAPADRIGREVIAPGAGRVRRPLGRRRRQGRCSTGL